MNTCYNISVVQFFENPFVIGSVIHLRVVQRSAQAKRSKQAAMKWRAEPSLRGGACVSTRHNAADKNPADEGRAAIRLALHAQGSTEGGEQVRRILVLSDQQAMVDQAM